MVLMAVTTVRRELSILNSVPQALRMPSGGLFAIVEVEGMMDITLLYLALPCLSRSLHPPKILYVSW